jgi:uncharacterized protein (DUF488 family)
MIPNIHTIYTIGHSNHAIEKFIGLLHQYDIDVVVDIRSAPYSKYSPHFNRELLSVSLKNNQIKYLFLGNELGARPKDKTCYVNHKVSFDKIKQTKAFQDGIQRVLNGAYEYSVALLCSEKDPVTCHRVILVSRVLVDKGATLKHILEDGTILEQAQVEQQLVKRLHLETTFFTTEKDIIQDAYNIQGEKIACLMQQEETDD